MFLIKMYLILGLAMFLVVLWDYKYLPKTADRLIKKPGDKSGFSLVVLAVRNLMVMALFAFFSASRCNDRVIRSTQKVSRFGNSRGIVGKHRPCAGQDQGRDPA